MGIFHFCISFFLIEIVVAQQFVHSPCLDRQPVAGFDILKFTSRPWYEQKRSGVVGFKCTKIQYTLNPNNKLFVSWAGTSLQSGIRKAWNRDLNPSAFSPGVFFGSSADFTDTIIDTDYETYAVSHGCKPNGKFSTVLLAVLTRDPNPSQDVKDKIKQILDNIASRYYMHETNHIDCAYE